MDFVWSDKGVYGVHPETGEFWPYVGSTAPGSVSGRVPISSRARITLDNGQTFCLGDILIRPDVGLPLVVINTRSFDFGSGYGAVLMFNTRYTRISSIYEDITLLLPHLAAKNEKIDFAFYGMKPF